MGPFKRETFINASVDKLRKAILLTYGALFSACITVTVSAAAD